MRATDEELREAAEMAIASGWVVQAMARELMVLRSLEAAVRADRRSRVLLEDWLAKLDALARASRRCDRRRDR